MVHWTNGASQRVRNTCCYPGHLQYVLQLSAASSSWLQNSSPLIMIIDWPTVAIIGLRRRIVDFSQGVGLRTLYTEMQTGIQTTHHPHPPVFCGLDQNFLKDTPQFYSFSSVVHAEFCWNCRFFPQPCMWSVLDLVSLRLISASCEN